MKLEKTITNMDLPQMDLFGSKQQNVMEIAGTPKVMVDGKYVHFPDQKPVLFNDVVLVPVNEVFEHLGFDVKWDDDKKAVLMKKDNLMLFVPLDYNSFLIRDCTTGEEKLSGKYNVSAQNINGKVMLPIEAFAEVGQFGVSWDEPTKTIVIITGVPTAHGNLTVEQIETSGLFDDRYIVRGGVRYYTLTRETSLKYAIDMAKSLRFFREGGVRYVEGSLAELAPVLKEGEFENEFALSFQLFTDHKEFYLFNAISSEPSPRWTDNYKTVYSSSVPRVGYFKVEVPSSLPDLSNVGIDMQIEMVQIVIRYQVRGAQSNKYTFSGTFEPDGTPAIDRHANMSKVHFGDGGRNDKYFRQGDLCLKVEWRRPHLPRPWVIRDFG